MKDSQSLKDIYKHKTLLFLGPGKSVGSFDPSITKKVNYIASLNDGILFNYTDFYFVGEKFIFDYVRSVCDHQTLSETTKIFLGINKNHKTRLNKKYAKKQDLPFSYYSNACELRERTQYDLPLSRKFSPRNMKTLSNLLFHISSDCSYYIRSRTLANALQILYGMGFAKIYLLGFMDSLTYDRNDYTHQQEYTKGTKNDRPQDRNEVALWNSFTYQAQILSTISHVFEQNGRHLYDLNPNKDARNGLQPGSLDA